MNKEIFIKNFYFTFGTDPKYPYGIHDYIKIQAENIYAAQKAFQEKYPNREGSDCLNYAFDYDQESWDAIKDKYYKDIDPIDIIIADSELEIEID